MEKVCLAALDKSPLFICYIGLMNGHYVRLKWLIGTEQINNENVFLICMYA